jgi:hypothetical protein
MNEHFPAALPAVPRPPELQVPLIAEAPPRQEIPVRTAEEIQAVDLAFVADREQHDAAAGLIGLWLSAPWVTEVIADHFRTPPEEDENHRRLGNCPNPHEHC